MNKFSWGARERQRLVLALASHFGRRFAVFGRGWGSLLSAQGPVAFDDQQKAMMRGRVVVGGSPYSYADYYMSNRPFFEVSSGIPTIELRTPRVDKILRDGDQVYFADSINDIIVTCERLLHTNPKELYAKAARAAKEIASRHTQYNRLRFQLSVAREFQLHGNKMEIPFDFFLPEVDLTEEVTFACMRSEQSIHTTEQKGL